MTRRRLPLEYVANDAARKAIFTKRKKGLFKKAHELSILCGINACFIIWSAFDSLPEVWPPSATIVQGILRKYKEVPEGERSKRRTSLEDYIKGRISKAEAQRMDLIRDTREKELTHLMNRCLSMDILVTSLPMVDLKNLRYIIDNTASKLSKRIEMLKDTMENGVVVLSNQLPQQLDQPVMTSLITPPMMPDEDALTAGEMYDPFADDDDLIFGDFPNDVWPDDFLD